MRVLSCLALLVTLSSVPALLQGQSGSCDIEPLSDRTNFNKIGDAYYFSGRYEYICTGNVIARSDSAVNMFGRLLLIGNVTYRDSVKTLESELVEYEGAIGRLVAHGDSRFTDSKLGSTLHAPQGLTYQKPTKDNPQSRIDVFSGRPHLTLVAEAGPEQAADTTDIDADRMEIVGENSFRGWGRVVIRRGEMNATGGQTVFNDSVGLMDIWETAHIKGDTYDVHGDSINANLEGDLFREVRVFHNARIDSEDLQVKGVRLVIEFDSGSVQRLVAIGATGGAATAADTGQATATTPSLVLTADSIDALAPKGKIDLVTAVGNALGSRTPDSLDATLPELIQRDWLRGDTVHAYLVEAPDSVKARRAQSDSSFSRVLDRLIATGSDQAPATATYRIRAEGDTTQQVDVNYTAARRIIASFRAGAIHRLDAEGQVRGLHLQPIRRPPYIQNASNEQQNGKRQER